MKANELMIGDIVQFNGSPYIIEEISKKGWVHMTDPVHNLRVPMSSDYILDFIEGVPLTKDILETNGWKSLNNKAWLGLTIGCDEVNIMLGNNYAEIEYLNMCYNPEDPAEVNFGANFEFPRKVCVHELQHIMRMYDIDKEIVVR